VVLSIPEYTDTSNGFKIRVTINPKLKGKCSLVEVRNGETGTANGCSNGTYFFTPTSPMQTEDSEDPGKTPDSASFGLELDIEPEVGAAGNQMMGQGPTGDAGVYRDNPWAKLYDPSRKTLRAADEFISENLNVAKQYGEWLTGGESRSIEDIPAGSGASWSFWQCGHHPGWLR